MITSKSINIPLSYSSPGMYVKGITSAPINKILLPSYSLETTFLESKDSIVQTVEEMRSKLIQLVMEKGTFLNDEVIELSQKLDKYILIIQSL